MSDKTSPRPADFSKQLLGSVGEYWAISSLGNKPLTHVVFPGLLLTTITFGHAAPLGAPLGTEAKSATAVAVNEKGLSPQASTPPVPAATPNSNKGVIAGDNGGAKVEGAIGQDTERWREGHRIESSNAQLTLLETERFTASLNNGERTLVVLENLALQRIAEAMKIDSADNRWVISGKITEYRDQNYLWIERATRAAKIAK